MLERAGQLRDGGATSLPEDEEYRHAIGKLRDDLYVQIYLDIQSLFEIWNINEIGLTGRQVRFLRESPASLGLVSTQDGSHDHLQAAITHFPDDE